MWLSVNQRFDWLVQHAQDNGFKVNDSPTLKEVRKKLWKAREIHIDSLYDKVTDKMFKDNFRGRKPENFIYHEEKPTNWEELKDPEGVVACTSSSMDKKGYTFAIIEPKE